MNQDRHKRKMSAIFSADVVEYSRLMEEDQAWTIKNIGENKTLISELVEEYKGRIVDAPGDNLLAEFSSVTNAVECAVKIQQELKKKNANIVENRRMEFRIGINLGEVFEEEGRIYGSGVNIAARMEGLSEAGGICISGRTYDHIRTQLDLDYEYLGEHNVKNISEPIRVYRVLTDLDSTGKIIREKSVILFSRKTVMFGIISIIIIAAGIFIWRFYPTQSNKTEQATIEPDQVTSISEVKETAKTIAVLPFINLSSDPEQEYFVDGLSEEILNSLCQIPDLTVIARTSSFSFKGTDKKIQEIASDLGVDHILEGSVRKARNDLRITAQLVKAVDGSHIWSKTYDRELKDIFDVQEDIASAVADELKVTLGIGKSLKQLGGTGNLEAYELYLVAKGQYNVYEYNLALESIDAAIALDPEFAIAWALKSAIHQGRVIYGPSIHADLERDAALSAAQKAIELEQNLADGYFTLGYCEAMKGKWIDAELNFRRALQLGTETISKSELGHFFNVVGHFKKSREIFEELRRKDPLNEFNRRLYVSTLVLLGDMQGAENENERCIILFGDMWNIRSSEGITHHRLGTGDPLSSNELEYSTPIFDGVKKYLDSPKEAIAKLHQLYRDEINLSERDITDISILAAYFGDPEFAMDAMEKGIKINTTGLFKIWIPVMHEVRQLPRFKEFILEIGLVDYWKEYGWPDTGICRPVGEDDFECD